MLIKEQDEWTALTYIWNKEQTDAILAISGDIKHVSWTDINGKPQQVNYSIPNLIQCKSCHEFQGKMMPIGPAARHLNKTYSFGTEQINQLDYLTSTGKLNGLKTSHDGPKIADYADTSAGLDVRARAYLDINCAHCHRPEGSAKNSALNLLASEKNPVAFGLLKTPIAAGNGSGGYKYDIVPGKPEESILLYRMNSLEPGVAMPELGRKMTHVEGVKLIEDWIEQMN
ncbi:MAG: hypothetical protein IPO92_16315 [Saprospiraceae bacterium]|nr:hypothetical protein [Saprospiraceae bacterium]